VSPFFLAKGITCSPLPSDFKCLHLFSKFTTCFLQIFLFPPRFLFRLVGASQFSSVGSTVGPITGTYIAWFSYRAFRFSPFILILFKHYRGFLLHKRLDSVPARLLCEAEVGCAKFRHCLNSWFFKAGAPRSWLLSLKGSPFINHGCDPLSWNPLRVSRWTLFLQMWVFEGAGGSRGPKGG